MDKKVIASISLVTITIVVAGIILVSKNSGPKSGQYDNFAKCLTEKGLVMYGAYWCSHCKEQKSLFGDSFQHVSYVECTVDIQKCQEKKIEGYPTWIDSTGKSYSGTQPLSKLAEISSCTLE